MRKGLQDQSVESAPEQSGSSGVFAGQAVFVTALLSALFFSWLWQAFRLYSYPGMVAYYDEPGQLFHLPLFTGMMLLALAWRTRFQSDMTKDCPVLGRSTGQCRILTLLLMWTPLFLMLAPASEGMSPMRFAGSWMVSALAGIGAALGLCRAALVMVRFTSGELLRAIGLASALTPCLNFLVLLMPERYWGIVAFLFPALFALMPCEVGTGQDENPSSGMDARIPMFFWLACAFAVFSESVYYNLLGALLPILPAPRFNVLILCVTGSLAAFVVLRQAHRSPVWYAFLLVIPVLVVGYTAWPLLHRESPGLSLGGLLFGYVLLNIYMLTAFLHTVSYRCGVERIKLVCGGIGLFALVSWAGSHNSGWIGMSIARGDSINSLFAFQAFAILVCSLAFVVYLDGVGFFRTVRHETAVRPSPEKMANTPQSLMDWPLEELEAHFREFGLTRQQGMIAAMLAQKTPDATICDTLNISPSTLKTHIRNIHRRLGISSRHELAWLVSSKPAGDPPNTHSA